MNDNATPYWMDGKTVSERKFCEYFVEKHNLIYYGENFFDSNGILEEVVLQKMITDEIKPYVDKNIALQVEKIMKAMKMLYVVTEINKDIYTVCFANGNYNLKEDLFTDSKEITPNRLAVNYNPNAKAPEKWFAFLRELFNEDDIRTVQQYLGYCMIPTTIGQFMLLLIGEGGEGKSVIGNIIKAIFGNSCARMKISTLVNIRFALSMLENRLVMNDDDMQMAALKETDLIKNLITNEGKMVMEKKHGAFHEGDIYARIIAFANGTLDALYDKSEGFRRRQLIISVKRKNPDRKDNKMLSQEIIEDELEGIALWMIEGLKDLISNKFEFYISENTLRNLHEIRKNDNNIILFLESKDYLCFGKDETSTTKALYRVYCQWCDDNFYDPCKSSSFEKKFKKAAEKYGIYPKTVHTLGDKDARGYIGVSVRLDPGRVLIRNDINTNE